jgi:hypothetical protein
MRRIITGSSPDQAISILNATPFKIIDADNLFAHFHFDGI